MLGELLLTIGIALIVYAFYKLTTNNARYFEERNLKYRGVFDSLCTIISIFCGRTDAFEIIQRSYNEFPDEPWVLRVILFSFHRCYEITIRWRKFCEHWCNLNFVFKILESTEHLISTSDSISSVTRTFINNWQSRILNILKTTELLSIRV